MRADGQHDELQMILGNVVVALLRWAAVPLYLTNTGQGKTAVRTDHTLPTETQWSGKPLGNFLLDRNTAVQAVPAPAGEIPEGGGVACCR